MTVLREPARAVPALRFSGSLGAIGAADRRALFERSTSADPGLRVKVAAILDRVRREGDAALLALAREHDRVALESLEVPRERCRQALAALDPELRAAMERAARNIETGHRADRPRASEVEIEPGVVVGRRPDPLARVGVYAPGGRARYPSSVLMGTIPARVAGVREIVLCSPPGADGLPPPALLAAAEISGVTGLFAIGGAGAIAAMAFGTASVPRVDRIVGPGNVWVTEAKLQVAGFVATDAPAGPSEVLVIADDGADPEHVARELIAQAEHDPDACTLAVAIGAAAARAIACALASAVPAAARREIVEAALAAHGGVLVADSLDQALAFATDYAAEHVVLAVADPRAALDRLRNCGAVFLGASSSVAFGDYLTGANHVLPTGGLARSHSGLSAHDFVRWTGWQEVGPDAAARLAADVETLAHAEGLEGHAAAARAWADGGGEGAGQGGGVRTVTPDAPGERARRSTPRVPRMRPDYREIPVYSPAPARVAADLSDNTSLFGPAPAALRTLRDCDAEALSRYPEPYSGALRETLARRAGVAPEEIVVGCGSDDLLDAAFRAFGEPGDAVAFSDPTFSMVPVFARANGLEPVAVPSAGRRGPDPDRLLATRARILYLCSPNNPTGTIVPATTIDRVIRDSPGLVILDEAYAEFAGVTRAQEAPTRGNLLVLRTLSKAFGLAGLRVGWAIAARGLIAEVEKARGPYKVSGPAERAARAALEEDGAWVDGHVRAVVQSRERLAAALRERGFSPLPSAANFVLIPMRDAAAAGATLARAGVAVRAFHGLAGIGDAIRVTAGPWPLMERALAALDGEPR